MINSNAIKMCFVKPLKVLTEKFKVNKQEGILKGFIVVQLRSKRQINVDSEKNNHSEVFKLHRIDLRTVFVSYFFVIVTVIVTVIVPYAMFILLL